MTNYVGYGTLLVVVGMVSEARIVAGPGTTVVISGGRTDTLEDRLRAALTPGISGLVSFGVCGGLDPGLTAGDLIINSSNLGWRDRLSLGLPEASCGQVIGSATMVGSAGEKSALRRETGANAVDMETHIVTRVAVALGLPFAVIRAVSDPADHALPRAAMAGLKADGRPDIGAVLGAVCRRPWELPALLRTAREAGQALRALNLARERLGPDLGSIPPARAELCEISDWRS